MSVKDNFTPEEWKSLLKVPMLASYAVAGAAPSKQEGFVQEMSAVADAIVEGEQTSTKDSLVGAVVADIIANAEDEQRGLTEKLSIDETKGRALEACRAAASLLQSKADAKEAYEYKRWVLRVAQRVAAAAKEGGLFGLGGEQISGSEVEIINEIGEAINI
jgi:hypothetical protein